LDRHADVERLERGLERLVHLRRPPAGGTVGILEAEHHLPAGGALRLAKEVELHAQLLPASIHDLATRLVWLPDIGKGRYISPNSA
jgi:hypothetical protein